MNNEQYFRECDLIEKRWRCRVQLNRKAIAVNQKLAAWHRENPDTVNVAQWRIERARRQAATRVA